MARDDRWGEANPIIGAAGSPVERVEGTESVERVDGTEPVEGAEGADGTESVEPVEPVEQWGEVSGRPGGGAGLGRLGLLAGLAVIAGLLWGLGRIGGEESATGDRADGEQAAGPAEDAGDDGNRSGSGVRFSLDAGTDVEAGLEPAEPESSIRVTPAQPVIPAPFTSGPVLATPTGFTLYYGGDAPLQAVDLDTGELSVYGIRADPVLVTGRTLVIHRAEVGLNGWVDLDDAGQQVGAWKPGRVSGSPDRPDLLWVLDVENDEPHPAGPEANAGIGSGRWELIDTTRSRVMFRLPADLHPGFSGLAGDDPVGGVFDALHHGPLVSIRPDGVYRHDEDGYRRIAPAGWVLAVDDQTGRALVASCGPTPDGAGGAGGDEGAGGADRAGGNEGDGACPLGWVDIATGQGVDWPVPEIAVRAATVTGGGRWLHSVSPDGMSELLELDSGRRLRHAWATSRPAVSPDGRWLAEWLRGVVVISDLDGGGTPITAGWVRDFEEEGSGSLVFAPASTG